MDQRAIIELAPVAHETDSALVAELGATLLVVAQRDVRVREEVAS